MAKKKNLTLSKVKKVSKQVDEKVEYIIEEGFYKGEQITFTPYFNDVVLDEMLIKFGELLNEIDDKKLEMSDEMKMYILHLLMIKYFTHFKDELPEVLVGEEIGLLDVLEHFRKTGLLNECLNKMFLASEIQRVLGKLTDFSATGMLMEDIDEKVKDKFAQLKINHGGIFEQIERMNVGGKFVEWSELNIDGGF